MSGFTMRMVLEAAEGKGRAKVPSVDAIKRLANRVVDGRAKVAMPAFTHLPIIELYPPGKEHGPAWGALLPELMAALEKALPRIQGYEWFKSIGYANYENKISLVQSSE